MKNQHLGFIIAKASSHEMPVKLILHWSNGKVQCVDWLSTPEVFRLPVRLLPHGWTHFVFKQTTEPGKEKEYYEVKGEK